MSALDQLATKRGRRDEVPNQELAGELATHSDKKGIQEIAENLWNKDKAIQGDCIKVLYEVGYLQPELIANYVDDFVRLLASRQNRLVWGGMIALSTVAALRPAQVYKHRDEITRAMENGSVITMDNGVKVLAQMAAADQAYCNKIFPYLLDQLQHCRPKEVAQHAESILPAVNAKNKKKYVAVLSERQPLLSPAQGARLKKIFRTPESV